MTVLLTILAALAITLVPGGMGRPCVDRAGGIRRRYPLKQFVWYAIQTGIVAWVLYIDHISGMNRPGVALVLGVGWALSFTVVVHLAANGCRALWRLLRPAPAIGGHGLDGVIGDQRPGEALPLRRGLAVGDVREHLRRAGVRDNPRQLR